MTKRVRDPEYHRQWRAKNQYKVRAAQAKFRENNREGLRIRQRQLKALHRAIEPEAERLYYQEYHKNRRSDPRAMALMFCGNAQKRALKNGWDFDLFDHFDEIVERIGKWKCELSGVELGSGGGSKNPNSMSFDRIDSSKGYVISNLRIIAWCLNCAFSNWGDEATAVIMRRWLDRKDLA